jgi:glycosyltransferase involved in cell wall biosynthesis
VSVLAPQGEALAESLRSTDASLPRSNAIRPSPVALPQAPSQGVAPVSRERPPSVSCVVPCFNEAENLQQLLPQLRAVLDSCRVAWEIILVDDGSRDDTALVAARWAFQPGFRAIRLSRNFGKEAALTAGLDAANGDVVVTLDADLQHPPALVRTFLEHWQRGADVVYAARVDRRDESVLKRLGARWFYRLLNSNAGQIEIPPDAGDFRLLDRRVVDALLSLPERSRFMKGLYAWVGFDAVAVPYVPDQRAHGRSRFGFVRLLRLSIDGLTAFTTWPLRAVSAIGFVIAVLSFLYGGYLTVDYLLYGHEVSGWTTIVVSLMLFAGIQLISLGVVGEYIGRVFDEVKARPLYIIKQQLGSGLQRSQP